MKISTFLSKYSFLSLLVLCITGLLIFQAQDVPRLPGDNDPNIDHVPYDVRMYFATHHSDPLPDFVYTTPDGYDNFLLGIDNAEVFGSTHPRNPQNFACAFNTNNGHWTANGLDFTTVVPPVPNTQGDPYSAVDSLGNLYYITLNSALTGSWVNKSTNMGQSWGTAVSACTGNDRETISCDMSNGPYGGYIYCGETPGTFYRSTDGGASFNQTATMSNGLPGF